MYFGGQWENGIGRSRDTRPQKCVLEGILMHLLWLWEQGVENYESLILPFFHVSLSQIF
jgi:hypothetical protein